MLKQYIKIMQQWLPWHKYLYIFYNISINGIIFSFIEIRYIPN